MGGSIAAVPSVEDESLANPSVPPLAAPLPSPADHMPASVPGYSLRRDVHEVRLQFTVADEQGRPISDLSSGEVHIFDNREPVERFSAFERDENLPLEIGLLIDTSDSVKPVLQEEKAAATRFLERVLRPQTDSAFVMGFAGEIKVWQPPTSDRRALFDAITRLQEPGWGTLFYDALYSACDTQLSAKDGRLAHRALVVLSDGDDTQSFHDLRDVLTIALRSGVQVYALTIRTGKGTGRGDVVLQRIAQATGGRVYFARSSKEFDDIFGQIEQDLRSQYYVSFPPQQATPGFHSLRVEVRPPQKLEVHSRQGYFVTAE